MKMTFAERMSRLNVGIFSKLAQKKNERKKEKKTVIDLSVGAPNIPPAKHIIEALTKAASDPKNYVYAISDLPELQDAVAAWYKNRFGVIIDPRTEVCSLLGSQDGLSHIALSIVDEGDTVLVQDPCYPVFTDGPALAGADLYYMQQKRENDYIIKLSDIPQDVAKRAKFMIVSYPNNPTTAMAPASFYEELIDFAKKNNIMLLHDNAYSELVFDGKRCGSFLTYPGAMEVGVEFNSLSKTYGLAGARIGFCIGNPEMVGKLKELKSNMDYGMFIPVQKAAIAALTGDQSCVAVTRAAYEHRRDVLCDGLIRIGWKMEKPSATMFVWAPVPGGFKSSEDFVDTLFDRTGVLVTPGNAFGPSGEGYVRMALVQDDNELRQAIDAIDKSGILKM